MKITRVKLSNYRRFFRDTVIEINSENNIFVGDNGIGKSSIIEGITLALGASIGKVEAISFERIVNQAAIQIFLNDKNKEEYPTSQVEITFQPDSLKLFGMHNSEETRSSGVIMKIGPNSAYQQELEEFRLSESQSFPFDYYMVTFKSFSGADYNQYSKLFNFNQLSFESLSNNYEVKKFIRTNFENVMNPSDQSILNHRYRNALDDFTINIHSDYPQLKSEVSFHANSTGTLLLNSNLQLKFNNQDIWNLGKGEKLLTILGSAIDNSSIGKNDYIFIEEPESHLTTKNIRSLVENILRINNCQTFITTHDSMIASGIGLNDVNLVTGNGCFTLKSLNEDTSKFFKKTTNNNLLNFIINSSSLLVEGNSEYILMPEIYRKLTGKSISDANFQVISVGSLSFPRYIELAEFSKGKVAIMTDNDGDYEKNIIEKYREKTTDRIEVFSERNEENYTFEAAIYNSNSSILEEKMLNASMNKGLLAYMLANKTEASYRISNLLTEDADFFDRFKVPDYIVKVLEWIN